jgi:hypothetical protein
MFDDHEEHESKSTSALPRAKQRSRGAAHARDKMQIITFSTFEAGILLKIIDGNEMAAVMNESQHGESKIASRHSPITNRESAIPLAPRIWHLIPGTSLDSLTLAGGAN